MKSKKILLLFIPIIYFIGRIIFLEYQQRSSSQVKLVVEGYDPYDFFRGRYVYVKINWDRSDCNQFLDGCPKNEFNSSYKFYMNEEIAREIDRNGNIHKMELIFFYKKDKEPKMDDLLINGFPYVEWYKNLSK